MPAKIRKPIYELTADDFLAFPVWEYALDEEGEEGQDETTVRPYFAANHLDPSEGTWIVAATFTLADGTLMSGYLTPPSSMERYLGRIQPQIFTNRGQVSFWCGRLPPETARCYELLGRNASSVFPVRFESAVPLVGGPVVGTLLGFLCLEDDFETVRTIQ
jgi:hypothetical protein